MPPPADLTQDTQLALILQRLEALTVMVREGRDEQRKINDDHEERLRLLERLAGSAPVWHGVQALFTAIASAIAAAIGRQQ